MPPRVAWILAETTVVEQGLVVEGMESCVPKPCPVAASPEPESYFENKGVFGFSDAEEIKRKARE